MKVAYSLQHAESYGVTKKKWAKKAHACSPDWKKARNNAARNREILRGKTALYDEWDKAGGWETNPDYMKTLMRQIERQRHYLRARTGDDD